MKNMAVYLALRFGENYEDYSKEGGFYKHYQDEFGEELRLTVYVDAALAQGDRIPTIAFEKMMDEVKKGNIDYIYTPRARGVHRTNIDFWGAMRELRKRHIPMYLANIELNSEEFDVLDLMKKWGWIKENIELTELTEGESDGE